MTMPGTKADTSNSVPPAAPTVPAAEQEAFVINLCSSTTPMALTQPQLAELKQYSFFVSRRLEDGRERFRLHMGYFDSLLQAEELLPVVRDIYPGAWAGEAPGKRLRARAAAPIPTNSVRTPAPAPAPAAPPALEQLVIAAPPAGPSAEMLARMPTLSAAPDVDPVPSELTLELVPEPAAPAAPAAPTVAAAPVMPAPPVAAARHQTRNSPPKRTAAAMPFDKRSNVREVLESLDDSTRKQPALTVPSGIAVRTQGVLPESQVMRLLEEKRGDPLNTTSTPAAFSIQLQWSVTAIDLAKVPPLAIFGAYTLYTVEGSREGRRWFGLRLGFFSDANSAKQVAQYVRSEFSSVAVVPVSLKERDGASGASGAVAAASRSTEQLPDRSGEFKLLEDIATVTKPAESTAPPATSADSTAGKAAKPSGSAKKGTRGRGNRVDAHERRSPKTLEETLEILGADKLQIEGGKRELISEGEIRHLDVKVQKNSPFTRLLDRLAERNR